MLIHSLVSCPIGRHSFLPRFFCAVAASADASPLSRRQQLRQIPVDPTLLQHIQRAGVGRTKRKNRSRQSRRRDPPIESMTHSSNTSPPPPPFGRGCRVGTIGTTVAKPRKRNKDAATAKYADYDWPRSSRVKGAIPEIALIGRSNVGKSTLLNALLYTTDVLLHERDSTSKDEEDRRRRRPTSTFTLPHGGPKASMSPHPGETKAITWYQVRDQGYAVRIVDLPGYGFAYTGPEQVPEYTTNVMIQYLLHHKPLQRMLLLLDARHGLKPADITFLQQLEQSRAAAKTRFPALQLVLTKCDMVPQDEIARRVLQIRERLSVDVWQQRELASVLHPTLFVAARERQGLLAVQRSLAQVATTRQSGRRIRRNSIGKMSNDTEPPTTSTPTRRTAVQHNGPRDKRTMRWRGDASSSPTERRFRGRDNDTDRKQPTDRRRDVSGRRTQLESCFRRSNATSSPSTIHRTKRLRHGRNNHAQSIGREEPTERRRSASKHKSERRFRSHNAVMNKTSTHRTGRRRHDNNDDNRKTPNDRRHSVRRPEMSRFGSKKSTNEPPTRRSTRRRDNR